MNGNDVLNVHPQTAAYRAMKVCSVADNESTALSDAAQDGYEGEAQFFISVTLAPNINNRCSALTGAERTSQAHVEPFIASGAAVGFWYFFPTEKGLGPRGYERAKHHKWLVDNTNHGKPKRFFCNLTKPYKRKNLPNIIREAKSYYLITLFLF